MHDRKFKMYQASDAFVALPGGFGTLDELLEILYEDEESARDIQMILS